MDTWSALASARTCGDIAVAALDIAEEYVAMISPARARAVTRAALRQVYRALAAVATAPVGAHDSEPTGTRANAYGALFYVLRVYLLHHPDERAAALICNPVACCTALARATRVLRALQPLRQADTCAMLLCPIVSWLSRKYTGPMLRVLLCGARALALGCMPNARDECAGAYAAMMAGAIRGRSARVRRAIVTTPTRAALLECARRVTSTCTMDAVVDALVTCTQNDIAIAAQFHDDATLDVLGVLQDKLSRAPNMLSTRLRLLIAHLSIYRPECRIRHVPLDVQLAPDPDATSGTPFVVHITGARADLLDGMGPEITRGYVVS